MSWETIDRPGQTGTKKAEIFAERDRKYGKGNWRTAWEWNGTVIDKLTAFHICEMAYYADSFKREGAWKRLRREASDVYDLRPKETESGIDYTKQLDYTRFHDICIRRVLLHRG